MSERRFSVGDRVRVRSDVEDGNPRTPAYAKGRVGTVIASHGIIDNPLDHHHPYPPLYTIVFRITDLTGKTSPDLVTADLHEEWLERV